jgi:DNA repair exonuclease SbcCD ATPase subunit
MKSNFEEKRQARIEGLREKANKHSVLSNERINSQNIKTLTGMMGEPIKIGHHSQRRHERLIEKADNDMRKAVEHANTAEEYQRRAEAAENNNAIFSDDPDAIKKLKEKLEGLETAHSKMKSLNAKYRKAKGDIDKMDVSEDDKTALRQARKDNERMYGGRMEFIPYRSYALQNSNAEINRIKKRIKKLEAQSADETTEIVIGEVKIKDNVEDNRVQIFFPDKPNAEVISRLKRYGGFRWARSIEAWQRHRSARALYLAKEIVKKCYYNEVGA